MRNGPDFICIGSQKAGTGTLYDMLRGHEDCWMPPLKELWYLSPALEKCRAKHLKRVKKKRKSLKTETNVDRRDSRFLNRYLKVLKEENLGVEGYRQIFSGAGDAVTGDITPAYAVLRSNQIENIAREFPTVKIIYVLRDPLSRLWSNARMTAERKRPDLIADLGAFRRFCRIRRVKDRSLQSTVIKRWRRHFGDRLRILFYDDLRDDPLGYYSRVCEILSIRADPALTSYEMGVNRKARESEPMPPDFEAFARKYLAGEYGRLAKLAGGHAIAWRDGFRASMSDATQQRH